MKQTNKSCPLSKGKATICTGPTWTDTCSAHWQKASKLSALRRFEFIWKENGDKCAHQYSNYCYIIIIIIIIININSTLGTLLTDEVECIIWASPIERLDIIWTELNWTRQYIYNCCWILSELAYHCFISPVQSCALIHSCCVDSPPLVASICLWLSKCTGWGMICAHSEFNTNRHRKHIIHNNKRMVYRSEGNNNKPTVKYSVT